MKAMMMRKERFGKMMVSAAASLLIVVSLAITPAPKEEVADFAIPFAGGCQVTDCN